MIFLSAYYKSIVFLVYYKLFNRLYQNKLLLLKKYKSNNQSIIILNSINLNPLENKFIRLKLPVLRFFKFK